MNELKDLLQTLKDNIDPKLQTQLLETFEMLNEDNQKSIIAALNAALRQRDIIKKYEFKRNEAIKKALDSTKEIEDRVTKKCKEALKEAEAGKKSLDLKAADNLINQL